MRIGRVCGLLVLAFLLSPNPSFGQEADASEDALNVFLDCQTFGCDSDFFRRQIPVVNWVLDREVADVHVLITSRGTGGGGRAYEISLLGQEDLEGEDTELTWTSSGDAVQDEVREGLAEQLTVGLVRYIAGTPAADRLRVSFAGVEGGPAGPGGAAGGRQAAPEDDPWDYWVFTISANGFLNGESSARFGNYNGSVSANRTTEDWKFNLRANRSQNTQEFFDIPDGDGGTYDVKETRKDWGMSSSLVKSLGEQWALGVRGDMGSSTYLNQDFRWSLKPGVEYNFFPYEESSRRSLTLQYLVGPNYWDYAKETIYGEIEETRIQEELTARLSLVQPWGRWSTSVSGQHYFHDTDLYSVTVFGSVNVRLFQGFSIRMTGNYSWIRDQLHIEAGDLAEQEILLRQRQLQTSFRYFTSFGIQYRFGSIFNNVVNPRFGGSGGGEVIFF